MKHIVIGSDHAGYELKEVLISYLHGKGWKVIDHGTHSADSTDYPDYAHPVASDVEAGLGWGVLICGSANGVCMTANKHAGVRAALCWLPEIAALARQHNDANALCLPARYLSEQEAIAILDAFLENEFEGGRHSRRVDKIACA